MYLDEVDSLALLVATQVPLYSSEAFPGSTESAYECMRSTSIQVSVEEIGGCG